MEKTLGELVRELREQRGWTQLDLAKRCGYKDYSTISKIEAGRPVTQKIIVKLATALGVSPIYLIGWEEKVKEEEKKFDEAFMLIDRTSLTNVKYLMQICGGLNEDGIKELEKYADFLKTKPEYQDDFVKEFDKK